MKKTLTILLLFLVNTVFSQTKEHFISDFTFDDTLNKDNFIDDLSQYDFSILWKQAKNDIVYGIIGEEHQRLMIKIISVEKNPYNPNEYITYGKSMVKGTICDFIGIIKLTQVKKLNKQHFGVDDKFKSQGIKSQGIVVAQYTFKENTKLKNSGIFKGELYSKWYIDNIELMSDGYSNNAFIGIWKSNSTSKEKLCNWGDYRVPLANKDFDIGAGEFSVSEKYIEKGWLSDSYAWKNRMANHAIESTSESPNSSRDENKSKVTNKKWWK